ncbi:AraC family transcriptional regulator [Caulobacter sp. 17J80-11]|uniref:AraC family transcriptional regulator n=1 Tax=Caulobacter sp. 17J80-11 TaxID=2763502 RepID=UPI001653A61C|nr:AraC family transcriptional regulator [Caulobacter sp. 17J80-11]MBC6981905.1 helix-turn-helix transcriptional regulator [Caulobacter sp. 17J80-11]
MTVHSRGRICLWEGGSLWIGETTGEFEPHAHHAVQLTLGFDSDFRFEARDKVVCGRAAMVASDVLHAFRAQGEIAHLFVEPESRIGRALLAAYCGDAPVALLPEAVLQEAAQALRDAYRASAPDERLAELAKVAFGALAPAVEQVSAPDARVREVIEWANENVAEPLSLEAAAEVAGLSPGRTRHLFVQETGVAFRSYVLWLRLMRAVRRYAEGAPLTEAAYDAGFADSAHLSRTFRRMFGTPASALRMA